MNNEVNQGFDVTPIPKIEPIDQQKENGFDEKNAPQPGYVTIPARPEADTNAQSDFSDAITSMVLGIVSILMLFLPAFPGGMIVSVILGNIAKKKGSLTLRSNPTSNAMRGFACAGKITGLLGFILGIVGIAVNLLTVIALMCLYFIYYILIIAGLAFI